jgi:hypothetical protein
MADNEENEKDSGFPSGPWSGFYTMRFSRQFHRQSLDLTFRNKRMTGRGQDDIGSFVISGHYDLETRKVWWSKRYLGAHEVHYAGVQSGRTIQGDWTIPPNNRGGFSIWPGGESSLDGEFFVVEEKPIEHRLPALVED